MCAALQDVQIAVLDNGIERTDTMEGQLLPFGQDPADFTTLSFRFLPAVQRLGPSASAGAIWRRKAVVLYMCRNLAWILMCVGHTCALLLMLSWKNGAIKRDH